MIGFEMVMQLKTFRLILWSTAILLAACPLARAAEHVTLKNGFELDCVRREAVGDKVRLYFAGKAGAAAEDSNYQEFAADEIARGEILPDPPEPVVAPKIEGPLSVVTAPTKEEMHEMLAHAGE